MKSDIAHNSTPVESEPSNGNVTIRSLQNVELSLYSGTLKPKPRRRLNENRIDRADGLDTLIQKTKAIGLRVGEEGLSANENGNEWLEALSNRRNLLWGMRKIHGSDVHAEELIRVGVLDKLLYHLDETVEDEALFECLWIITNIAAGPTAHTTTLVDKNFLIPLGQLLQHPKGNIRTQAAWAIGNIIGDREGYRDLVLKAGLLPAILNIWKGDHRDMDAQKESFRISFWIVDNMCRYKPDWHLMMPAFEVIPKVILSEDDPNILKECCWALARILHQSGRDAAIDQIISPQLCTRLMEILRWEKASTTHPVLRALINLSSSKNTLHLKYLFNAGIITQLEDYLLADCEGRQSFAVFATQIIGNLAIHQDYGLKISARYTLCQWTVKSMLRTKDTELSGEICILLRNLLFHQNSVLASIGVVQAMIRYLDKVASISKIQLICLEVISHLMKTPSISEESSNLLDFILMLQSSGLYNKLLKIFLDASDVDIDDMNQDLLDEDSDNDENSDNEGENLEICKGYSIPFEVSNPHNPSHPHYGIQNFSASGSTIRQKIATISLRIMRHVFENELMETIRRQQQDISVCQMLTGMSVGDSNSKMSDLESLFNKLNG